MNRLYNCILFLLLSGLIAGCEKNERIVDSYHDLPSDILFEEFSVGRFQHKILDAPFKSKIATFNVVKSGTDWAGFAISNRNYRKNPTEIALLDTSRFSVYTGIIHAGGNFLVAKTNGDNAYVTFDRAVEPHSVLVANTTQVYYTIINGVGNVTNGQTFAPGTRVLGVAQKDWAKVIATGFLNGSEVGKVEFFLADRNSNAEKLMNFTVTDWLPMKLSNLGKVDKILFQFDTSDKTAGVMNTPPYFCLDGFRFNENL